YAGGVVRRPECAGGAVVLPSQFFPSRPRCQSPAWAGCLAAPFKPAAASAHHWQGLYACELPGQWTSFAGSTASGGYVSEGPAHCFSGCRALFARADAAGVSRPASAPEPKSARNLLFSLSTASRARIYEPALGRDDHLLVAAFVAVGS